MRKAVGRGKTLQRKKYLTQEKSKKYSIYILDLVECCETP